MAWFKCLHQKEIAAIIKLLHRQCKCARVQRWGPSKALLHAQWKIYRTKIWYSFTRKSFIQKYHAVWTHKCVPLQNRDPNFIVLHLIYTNSNSNWNCYKLASNLMLELTRSSSGSWSSTKSVLFLVLCWMQNGWPPLTLIDSTSAQATSSDCWMFIHLWTLRIHSWSSVSLLAVL